MVIHIHIYEFYLSIYNYILKFKYNFITKKEFLKKKREILSEKSDKFN